MEENKILEEKILLLGKHVIINDGDFKGVSGILKSLDIEIDKEIVRNHKNEKLMSFIYESVINCEVIVNSENTITVRLEQLSKLT